MLSFLRRFGTTPKVLSLSDRIRRKAERLTQSLAHGNSDQEEGSIEFAVYLVCSDFVAAGALENCTTAESLSASEGERFVVKAAMTYLIAAVQGAQLKASGETVDLEKVLAHVDLAAMVELEFAVSPERQQALLNAGDDSKWARQTAEARWLFNTFVSNAEEYVQRNTAIRGLTANGAHGIAIADPPPELCGQTYLAFWNAAFPRLRLHQSLLA